jgi:hypothetical protein
LKYFVPAALLISSLAAVPAIAQTTHATTPPAVSTRGDKNTTAAPVAGANSFTMAQAQKRIEEHGYTQVSVLQKDDKSVWRGVAAKNGRAMNVAVDYQGNVTAN